MGYCDLALVVIIGSIEAEPNDGFLCLSLVVEVKGYSHFRSAGVGDRALRF